MKICVFILLFLETTSVIAQDNKALLDLFDSDQVARQDENKDWDKIRAQDSLRRNQVETMLKQGEIKTANDFYHAAFIFQHGESKEGIRIAHAFATLSSVLSENPSKANWIKAASWDRLMLKYEQPQWFGTQYVKDDSGSWALYPVEIDAVNDEEREAWSVPSLEKSEARVKKLNERK